jgi:hypothetical protein
MSDAEHKEIQGRNGDLQKLESGPSSYDFMTICQRSNKQWRIPFQRTGQCAIQPLRSHDVFMAKLEQGSDAFINLLIA